MDAELKHRLNYTLKGLRRDKSVYTRLLKNYEGLDKARLFRTRRARGGVYYYSRLPGQKKRNYIGTCDRPGVRNVQEAHFISEAISRIDHNLELINSLCDGFEEYDYASIASALPDIYKCSVPLQPRKYAAAAEKWKAEKMKFLQKFPENHPEQKIKTASDGTRVKTLSEVILYDRVSGSGLAAIYELPMPQSDYGPPLYPDLTILSPIDMKTEIIVEYVGRMDLENYRESFANRVGRYIKSGCIPGVNLFFVFGDKNGCIDSMQINKLLADIFGM